MLHIVQFIDKPASQQLRQELLPAHLSWLEEHQDTVLVAGSLRQEPDAAPVGGCWIVDASSKSEVVDLLRTDPFWLHGLRAGYEIFQWSKAFPDRKVPV